MRIPDAWKRFLDPDSGKVVGVLKRKSNIFGFLWENRRFLGFSRRGIDCAHSRTVKTLLWPWFREEIGVLKRKSKIFGFLWEMAHSLHRIRVKEAFSRFGNARNRFFAWFYPYIGYFGKKIFFQRLVPKSYPFLQIKLLNFQFSLSN